MIHQFKDRLDFSWRYAGAPWWEHVYRQAFPDFEAMLCVRRAGPAQRDGIDRSITLLNGKHIDIDEKVREEFHGWDVLIEYEHRGPRYNAPGWIAKDLRCDYLAYAWVPKRSCLLLPWLALRRAWLTHGDAWVRKGLARTERFFAHYAENDGYRTFFVCVPTDVLGVAINRAASVNWPAYLPSGGVPYEEEPKARPVPALVGRSSRQEALWDLGEGAPS